MENNDLGLVHGEENIDLPPGFRFFPTDEELITPYLFNKVMDPSFKAIAIGEADFNKSEPWDLPCKANLGEKSGYFYCVKDRKYPTGLRTNRATGAGYWKATGKDKEIYKEKTLIGMKKTLVFYTGRAPKGQKSNWVMHEFRLEGKLSPYNLPKAPKSEWVICRIFKKGLDVKKPNNVSSIENQMGSSLLPPPPPPLMDAYSYLKNRGFSSDSAHANHVTCFSSATMGAQRGGHEELFAEYFTNPSLQNLNSQIDPNFVGLVYPNSSLMQLIGAKQSFEKTEFLSGSQETGHASDVNHEISSH